MNVRNCILSLLFLLSALSATAQSFTLSGRVSDEEGNAIELATISCLEQGAVTMANLKGEFSLKLHSADSVVVKFSMVGYQTRTRVLRKPRSNQRLLVTLHPMKALDEVVVTERRRQTTGTEQLDIKNTKQGPSTTGNAVEEMVQQQAGVSSHNELSSQYNVRGGSFDENSVYINNVEVYRPLLIRSGQQEGLSVINSDMVERVAFSSGGFEAKYGDKMSSALDIQYRQPTRWEGNVQASLLGASAFIGYGDKKFSMSHGLRYKTNRYLLGSLETKGEYKPNFLDYQTYLTYRPNERWLVDFIGNISENHYNFQPSDRETSFGTMQDVKSFKVYFDGQEKDVFRTLFGTLRIQRIFSPQTRVTLLGSAFHTKEQETYDIMGQYWLDDAQTQESLGVGTYMEHARNYLTANVASAKLMVNHKTQKHDWEAGVTMKWEKIEENTREYEMRDSSGYSIPHSAERLDLIYSLRSQNSISSTRVEGYVQDTYRWQSGGTADDSPADGGQEPTLWTLNYGIRLANWSWNKETIVSPRISLAMIPGWNQDMTFRLSTGLYYQAPFYKEMRDTSTVNGQTVVTLNEHIKSQRSLHVVGAFDYRFRMAERPFRFTAEAYFKLMDNLIPYNVQNMKVVYYGENKAKGHAFGLDLKLFGEFVPGTDSWLTFSVMSTRQKINGVSVPLPTDQRWGVNLHFTDYFPGTERWKMTLRLAFADGLPFGAPHRGLEYQQFRAPAYKRADIGMSYLAVGQPNQQPSFRKPRVWIGIDGLNIFGISNVNSYYWVTDVTNQQYAVPNYLTGRQINGRVTIEF
ncbi:MAG: carboxypeptidase-like regulatory domain-containing protein [Prevotella sp.]|nr:carboxypeptidase-like regulatory domain-containing protein [Prevotella sp.]